MLPGHWQCPIRLTRKSWLSCDNKAWIWPPPHRTGLHSCCTHLHPLHARARAHSHTHTHAHTHTNTHTYTRAHMNARTHTRTHTHRHTQMIVHIYTHASLHARACTRILTNTHFIAHVDMQASTRAHTLCNKFQITRQRFKLLPRGWENFWRTSRINFGVDPSDPTPLSVAPT